MDEHVVQWIVTGILCLIFIIGYLIGKTDK